MVDNSKPSKAERYEQALIEFQQRLSQEDQELLNEQRKQKIVSEVVAKYFPNFSFVGFYDLRDDDQTKLYVGEYVTVNIFPCGEIEMGKGQCGQCASDQKTMIAYNVKELDNYIACDDETLSEIVVPCFVGEGDKRRVRTVFDIDSPNIGEFDEEDDKGLRKLLALIYP